jgi:multidrug efflux system membrane fusion protein
MRGHRGRAGRRTGGVAVLAAFALVGGCGGEAAPAGFQRPPAPVTVFTAVAQDVPVYLDEIGRALASETVVVKPQVSGRVAKVEFVDGADVGAETPLFRIDARPFDARLAEAVARKASAAAGVVEAKAARASAEARVGTARSRSDEAKAATAALRAGADAARSDVSAAAAEAARATEDARRFESLASSGAVSRQEVDRATADARAAEARLEAARRREASAVAQAAEAAAKEASAVEGVREAASALDEADARIVSAEASEVEAEAAVATARLDVEWATVKSPIAGRAGRRLVDAGNVVTANETELLTILRLDPAHVEFAVPEGALAAVQKAAAARVLAVQVTIPDDDAPARDGTLSFVDNAVQNATGTVRMRATIPNADGRFWPGRFARVRLVLETKAGAVLVPAEAPQIGAAGTFVYVVKADSTAEFRPVVVGQRHGAMVVLSSGVAAGERVVATGQIGVMPGGPVRPLEPPAAGAPGAGR